MRSCNFMVEGMVKLSASRGLFLISGEEVQDP